ncbi:MAG: hypothetical protein R3F59_02545 [Myxococcota bacterium]
MKYLTTLSSAAFIGCTSAGSDGADPPLLSPSSSSPGTPPSSYGPTSSPVTIPCAAVTGTDQVWLVSRADPAVVVGPAVAYEPGPGTPLHQLVGPDALGRLYLRQGVATLRSDDQGCSWSQVSATPTVYGDLFASATSERLYLSAHGDLQASDDGGVTFSVVGPAPERLLAASDTELRGQTDDQLLRSTDGGATWNSETTLPYDRLVEVDPTAPDRAAFVRSPDLWTFDGTGWTSSPLGLGLWAMRWNGGVLVVEARSSIDMLTSVVLRSETGAPPFVEVDWQPDVDDRPGPLWVDGDQVVVTGFWRPGEASDLPLGAAEGLVVVVDPAAVHRHTFPDTEGAGGIGVFDDRFVVGLRGTTITSNDR